MDQERSTPPLPSSSDMLDQWHSRSVEAPPVAPPPAPPSPAPARPGPGTGDPFAPADPFGAQPAPAPAPPAPEARPEAAEPTPVPAPPTDDFVAPWEAPPDQQRTGIGRSLLRLRPLVSIAVVLFVAVGAWMARGEKSVVDLAVGECFNDPGASQDLIDTVKTVDCAGPHDFEVFAVLTAPSGPYPGEIEMFAWADDACYAEFAGYTGVAYEDSAFFYTTLIPTEEGWADGDRGVDCVLGLSFDGFTVTPTEGSQRGAGRI